MKTQTLDNLIRGENLSADEARELMRSILGGMLSEPAVASVLTALRIKGETVDEIVGFAEAIREAQIAIDPGVEPLVDTCGTGGDKKGTFNISTAAAFVVAACGAYVAKHGNRSVSSLCGSADLLAELGADISTETERVKECIRATGVGFLFAPRFNPSLGQVMPVRRALGFPTVFNILGPLANPARATVQVLGVNRADLVPVMGEALSRLGVRKAFVIHGKDGMDEFTMTCESIVCEVSEGGSRTYVLAPEDIGLSRCGADELLGGDVKANAAIFMEILNGVRGAKMDAVAANAGFALVASGIAGTLREGVEAARLALTSGEALNRFNRFVSFISGGLNEFS